MRRDSRCAAQPLELALEPRDAVAHAPAIGLELRLAGAAPADAAHQARERDVGALGQPRQQVLELRELHLELAVGGARALREDVEDQLGAVDHAQLEPLGEVARLGRREVLIEDHQIDVALEGADHEVLEPARADQELAVDLRPVLGDDVHHVDARAARELAQLVELALEVGGPAARGHRDEDRALAFSDFARAVLARELFLARADPVAEVEVEQRGRLGFETLDPRARVERGAQRGDVGETGQPLVRGADRDHRVEPQHREVGLVVAVERRVADVGVDAAQPAQPAAARAQAAPVGHRDAARVAHHHVGDRAAPVDQHPDLAAGLARELAELAGELVGDQALRREPTLGQAFELAGLAGLQAVRVAGDVDRGTPQVRRAPLGEI